MHLNDEDRATLAGLLIESLEIEVDDDGVEAAWVDEIERRMEDLDSGQTKSIPWDAVRDRLHKNLNG